MTKVKDASSAQNQSLVKVKVVITEEAVNAMRAKGMTYAEIGKEFGVSPSAINYHRQKWDVEKVRSGMNVTKSLKSESSTKEKKVESSAAVSKMIALENEVKELRESMLYKEAVIQEHQSVIDRLKTERDAGTSQHVPIADRLQKDIKDDHRLLERESSRLENLLGMGESG
ncbi:hypothetical protein [Bacillus sp. FSL K6-3431]|uniref:hypothetical protein n=1 Tax=Bacillus sp. FSL K6-3431 TaxID=2921500 RepID=UPI0030F5A8F4